MKSNLVFIFTLFLILSLEMSCNKADKLSEEIQLIILQDYVSIFERDTLIVNYQISGVGIDSVCMIINSDIVECQLTPLKQFHFIPDSSGTYFLKLNAYHDSNMFVESDSVQINVMRLKAPKLKYIIKRNDELDSYFVGEQLDITVRDFYDNTVTYKQLKFFLNGNHIGTKVEKPYSFETPIITNSENSMLIELTDWDNRVHYISQPLNVPINAPPELNFNYYFQHDFFLTEDSVVFQLTGKDEINTEYVDFYVDDQYVLTDSVNTNWFINRKYNFGLFAPGIHTVYCIAYDDRGISSTSTVFETAVYQSYRLDDKIIDTEFTEDENLVFAISNSKLLNINPVSQEIVRIVDLPYSNAITIDFVNETQRLYIGFENGQLVYWDNISESFSTITTTVFSSINDLEIDYSKNKAILIADQMVSTINLSTNDIVQASVSVNQKSTLVYDRSNNTVIAGGRPDVDQNHFYKLKLENESLLYQGTMSARVHSKKILLNPIRPEFLTQRQPGGYTPSITLFDIEGFGGILGEYDINNGSSASFSIDGELLFVGESDVDEYLCVFNTQNFSHFNLYNIPLKTYDYVSHIIPTHDNTKVIIITENVFQNKVKLFFFNY